MFSTPWWLSGLVVVAGLVALYVRQLRRPRRDAVLFSPFELLEHLAPARPRALRHLPAVLLLAAVAALVVALSGPQAEAEVPRERAVVMLVIDVSLSMQALDVAPSRLAAAQAAAEQFADQLPPGINLGLESFAATAAVLVPPTTDRNLVKQAVDHLKLAESTATGEAIFAATAGVAAFARSFTAGTDEPMPGMIVLMSDGGQTVPGGPDAEDQPRGGYTAARAAATAHIPVSTISFGTTDGTVVLGPGQQAVPVPVDDAALAQIAQLSGGRAYTARTAAQLQQVYATLGRQVGYRQQPVDDSRLWLIGATLLSVAGLGTGLASGRRIPA